MNSQFLIDSIMRQTTVLIAQLSAASGSRAPLAHLADDVFLSLSRELEDQGLSRKLVADMFGLALRSYQRRVQRLKESCTDRNQTLWQAVHQYLQEAGPLTRTSIYKRFSNDDPEAIGAVLHDLVRTGLASRTGTGSTAVFSTAPEEARRLLAREGQLETAANMVWLDVCQHPGTSLEDVSQRLGLEVEVIAGAAQRLAQEGHLRSEDSNSLTAEAMVIPLGSEIGWETAVFDHFQAVASTIAAKLQLRPGSLESETTGGTTLSFEIGPQHPLAAEVRGLLARVRAETDQLWDRVENENAKHPIREEDIERVVFYCGQSIKSQERDR